jgi:hypothetical protein
MLQAAGAAALPLPASVAAARREWPIVEGPDTPKLCLPGGRDEASLRKVKQLGVDYTMGYAGRIPWQEADIRAQIERHKAAGLTL